jgi:RimJ/RimL family protein N-acetyltransferase
VTAASHAERVVTIGPGRRIEIRAVRRGDAAALMALYARLDPGDSQRRFFAVYRPELAFFTAMATEADRGGARLVAVATSDAGDEEVVGEAGYAMLPNGDGELAIVVDAGWRGWLGPFLLDALLATAATAGVPNLEADVLTTNPAMLGLLRARGAAVMDHDDWTVVRLLIGTGDAPTWPGQHDRPRLLVEGAGGRWGTEAEARAAGLHVITCPGPRDGRHGCPALAGRPCPLAAGADAIVVSRPGDEARWRDLLAAHADLHPGVPVCLEGTAPLTDAASSAGGAGAAIEPVPAGVDVVSFVLGHVTPAPDERAMEARGAP